VTCLVIDVDDVTIETSGKPARISPAFSIQESYRLKSLIVNDQVSRA
jgi:hypothetical protein